MYLGAANRVVLRCVVSCCVVLRVVVFCRVVLHRVVLHRAVMSCDVLCRARIASHSFKRTIVRYKNFVVMCSVVP